MITIETAATELWRQIQQLLDHERAGMVQQGRSCDHLKHWLHDACALAAKKAPELQRPDAALPMFRALETLAPKQVNRWAGEVNKQGDLSKLTDNPRTYWLGNLSKRDNQIFPGVEPHNYALAILLSPGKTCVIQTTYGGGS